MKANGVEGEEPSEIKLAAGASVKSLLRKAGTALGFPESKPAVRLFAFPGPRRCLVSGR